MTSFSFGLLKPRYTIAPDRVTIARNVWLPPVLAVLAAPGIYFLTQAFGGRHLDAGMFAAGFACVMAALFAFVMTPWLLPLGNRNIGTPTEPLVALERAMVAALG